MTLQVLRNLCSARYGIGQVGVPLGLAILVVALLVHAFSHSSFIIDDSFISYRYAENMARGHGLVFNPGERVEGYSNFVWTFATGVAIWMGADPVWFTRLVGYLCAAGIVLMTWKLARQVGDSSAPGVWTLLAPAAVVVWCPIAVWANSGLETLLFAFLLIACIERFLASGTDRGRRFLVGLLFGLLGATRPEGFGYLILLLTYGVFADAWKGLGWGAAGRLAVSALAGALVIMLPLLLWRWSYYGELLPNTVFAKSGTKEILAGRPFFWLPALLLVREGTPYILSWILSLGAGIPCVLALMSLRRGSRFFQPRLALALMIFGGLVVAWWNCGDWMPDSRLLVPVSALVFVLAQEGIRDLVTACGHASGIGRWKLALPIGAAVAMIGFPGYDFLSRSDHDGAPWLEERMPLGMALGRAAAPDDVLATSIAGTVPFYSKLHTIDVLGLNDKYIAHNGKAIRRWGKVDWAYVISRKPDIWHVTSNEARLLSEFPGFLDNYVWLQLPVGKSVLYGCDQLFVRKDAPSLDNLTQSLDATKSPAIRVLGMPCVSGKQG